MEKTRQYLWNVFCRRGREEQPRLPFPPYQSWSKRPPPIALLNIIITRSQKRHKKTTRTIHAIYESFIIREVLDIPIFFAAHKYQIPREGGGRKKSSTKTPLKNGKRKCNTTKTQLFSFVRICNSFSLFLYSSATTLTTTTKVRMFCGKQFAKSFLEDMAKYYEQKNRVLLDE